MPPELQGYRRVMFRCAALAEPRARAASCPSPDRPAGNRRRRLQPGPELPLDCSAPPPGSQSMSHRISAATASFLFAALVAAAAVPAQNDDADLNQRQAQKLNAFAKTAQKKGFPRQARIIWLQVIKLYDPENAEAHAGLGQIKVGNSWNPDPKYNAPAGDTGAGAGGAAPYPQFEAL